MSHFRSLSLRVVSVVLLALAGFLAPVASLDVRSLDIFREPVAPHPDIVIIAIDNKSLQSIGRWPWSRSIHATLLQKLSDVSPRVIGFDVMFSESEAGDADTFFATEMDDAAFPIILPVEEITHGGSDMVKLLLPLESLRSIENVQLGTVAIPTTSDGVARYFPKSVTVGDATYPSFGEAVAESLGANVTVEEHALINFAGSAGSIPTYSYTDVLNENIPLEAFREKIVLIGATASDLHDTALVPLSPHVMSGVEWQANVVSNALRQSTITLAPRALTVTLGMTIAITLLIIFAFVSTRTSLFLTIATCVVLPLLSWFFWKRGFALPYFCTVTLIIISFLTNAFERWYRAEQEKRALKEALKSSFSPVVMSEVLSNPALLRLGGERMEVTALFSDVRNFTTITESTEPEVLTGLMYEYFNAMTDEIYATDGVLSCFMGDGIYAFWGAPLPQEDHIDRAMTTAINMMKRLKELQPQWVERGLPFIDIGIGVNTGTAIVGNMGSEKRFDYTAIGDCINATARLESLNKEHKTNIIVSKIVEEQMDPAIERRFITDVLVKGKTVPLKIFEVTKSNWMN